METLGIENNHTMRICRGDDTAQQIRQRELRTFVALDQQYPGPSDVYKQQQQPLQQQQQPYYPQYQQQVYSTYPTTYDQQQQYNISPR